MFGDEESQRIRQTMLPRRSYDFDLAILHVLNVDYR
jgi:hypothetical protein